VRVLRHRYVVDGWGEGEVIVSDGVVLAHELPGLGCVTAGPSSSPSPHAGPAPPKGGTSPPEVTLADIGARDCVDFARILVGGESHSGRGHDADGAELASKLAGRVHAHLAGCATRYDDFPLDLSWCTEFQAELAQALRAVPWGEIVSYGELAALAGRPGAARAAGSFCARNRFALIFPCHRVVSSTGVGGYGDSGPALKRRLLALEGIEL
jgi:methylated-DNA-[protein]-cysteine S-methyltransferase